MSLLQALCVAYRREDNLVLLRQIMEAISSNMVDNNLHNFSAEMSTPRTNTFREKAGNSYNISDSSIPLLYCYIGFSCLYQSALSVILYLFL